MFTINVDGRPLRAYFEHTPMRLGGTLSKQVLATMSSNQVRTAQELGIYRPEETVCIIEDAERNPVARGSSVRHHKDRPDRDKGRKEALRRALEALGVDSAIREQFWAGYHTKRGKIGRHKLTDIAISIK